MASKQKINSFLSYFFFFRFFTKKRGLRKVSRPFDRLQTFSFFFLLFFYPFVEKEKKKIEKSIIFSWLRDGRWANIATPHAGQKWKEPETNKDSCSRRQIITNRLLVSQPFNNKRWDWNPLPLSQQTFTKWFSCFPPLRNTIFDLQRGMIIKIPKEKTSWRPQIGSFQQMLLLRGVIEGKEVLLFNCRREDFNLR